MKILNDKQAIVNAAIEAALLVITVNYNRLLTGDSALNVAMRIIACLLVYLTVRIIVYSDVSRKVFMVAFILQLFMIYAFPSKLDATNASPLFMAVLLKSYLLFKYLPALRVKEERFFDYFFLNPSKSSIVEVVENPTVIRKTMMTGMLLIVAVMSLIR
jgi:hypothetical protein